MTEKKERKNNLFTPQKSVLRGCILKKQTMVIRYIERGLTTHSLLYLIVQ